MSDATDMSAVIVPKSDQISADDLLSGPRTFRITGVSIRGGADQPVEITIEGERPWRPCKSMSRVLVYAWGPDASKYIGRSVTLYRDPSVKWGGLEVGGIRISHMSDLDQVMTRALTMTKGNKKPFTVKPLAPAPDDTPTPAERSLIGRINAAATLDALVSAWKAAADEVKALTPAAKARVTAAKDARKVALSPGDGE